VYIGLDTKCDPKYFGSSLIIHHYQRVYGSKIFTKEILRKLTNISLPDLCTIEQGEIRKSQLSLKKTREFSINYTGQNQRDTSSLSEVKDLASNLIKEAKLLKIPLKIADKGAIIIKPTQPPFPFGKGTGGMHIETKSRLREIGFAFYKEKGSDTNLGVATAILKKLEEFSDDDINLSGNQDNYQYVMATHNSKDPVLLANLYKRLLDFVKEDSSLFVIESSSKNLPISEKEKIEEAPVKIHQGHYLIKRYKRGRIRIMRGPNWNKPINNSKEILRMVDAQYNLEIAPKYWLQTQAAGKEILSELAKII